MERKVTPVFLEGKEFIVRTLERSDLTPRYLGWLTDPEINRFLESSRDSYTMEQLEGDFHALDDSTHLLFAIVHKASDQHVGNLSFNPISRTHRRTGMGGIIGERAFWGTRAFVEGMQLLMEYGFRERQFSKICCGMVLENIPCIVAAKKVGFVQEGLQKSHWRNRDGTYSDLMLFGKLNPYA